MRTNQPLSNPHDQTHAARVVASEETMSERDERTESSESGKASEAIARVRTFSHEHPWILFGGAVGLGVALGAGSRRVPAIEDAADAIPRERIRDSALVATIGSALLRAAVTTGLRRLAERM